MRFGKKKRQQQQHKSIAIKSIRLVIEVENIR